MLCAPLVLGLNGLARFSAPGASAPIPTLPVAQLPVAIRAAAHLAEHEDQVRKLWPGFWDTRFTYGVFPVNGGTLVMHPRGERPAGTIPPVDIALPTILKERAAFVPERQGSFFFDFEFRLGSQRIPAFSPHGHYALQRGPSADRRWTADSAASFVLFVLHESFHAHQLKHFAPLPNESSPAANLVPMRPHRGLTEDSLFKAQLARERSLLAAAVEAPDCTAATDPLNRYVEQRKVRLTQLPAPFAAFEDAHERAEGVATWIGLAGVHRIMTGDATGPRRDVLADLREMYRDSSGEPFGDGWTQYVSWHLYATGSAKTEILARCGVSTWRLEISGGRSLQSLLDVLVGRSGGPASEP